MVRSVPGPRNRSRSNPCAVRSAARCSSRFMCVRQAATGYSASSLSVYAISDHSRSTSGSPKTARAHPSVGPGTAVQARVFASTRRKNPAITSGLSGSAARRGSSPAMSSGSGCPLRLTRASASSRRWTIHGGVQASSSNGASSTAIRRRRWSAYRTSTVRPPHRRRGRSSGRGPRPRRRRRRAPCRQSRRRSRPRPPGCRRRRELVQGHDR
jgi:hypothetical protein